MMFSHRSLQETKRMKKVYLCCQHHFDIVWRRSKTEQIRVRDQQITKVLNLLEKYPDFKFDFDQAICLRLYLKDHPEKKKKIKEWIRSGRIEITGGLESIPDTNMVSGEGIVRNHLLGRRWYREELGATIETACLADAFGISAQIPQILNKFGYKYLKAVRTPGLETGKGERGFWWEGLDGSGLLYGAVHNKIQTVTHMCNLPIIWDWESRIDYSLGQTLIRREDPLYLRYSTEEEPIKEYIFEAVRRAKQKSKKNIVFAVSREYFRALEKKVQKKNLPRVVGEFNPSQPGTYITRIRLKQAYRKAESFLLSGESLFTCAYILGNRYPGKSINALWRKLAWVQFHDGICGCHIDAVNHLLMRICRNVCSHSLKMVNKTFPYIAARINLVHPSVVVFNSLNWQRHDLVRIKSTDIAAIKNNKGKSLPLQKDGGDILFIGDIPSTGYSSYEIKKGAPPETEVITDSRKLNCYRFETNRYRVTLSSRGPRIIDKKLAKHPVDGPFPQIRFREDNGSLWDENFLGPIFTDSVGSSELTSLSRGEIFTAVIWKGEISCHSGQRLGNYRKESGKAINTEQNYRTLYEDLHYIRWKKELRFYQSLDRIDVTIDICWKGQNIKIMAAFPVPIDLNKSHAFYSIPFGSIERRPYYEVPHNCPESRRMNTNAAAYGRGNWPALYWVAYQDERQGVILANTGTPSHRIQEGLIQVGLIRSGTRKSSEFTPSRESHDNGNHHFEFSYLPYKGDFRDKQSYRLGYERNSPLFALISPPHHGSFPEHMSFLSLSAPNLICSGFKKSESGKSVVVRTFEIEGKNTKGSLTPGFDFSKMEETNLEELYPETREADNLEWSRYEIKTLLLVLPRK